MMNDAVRCPIGIPPYQVPYLEKHRIVEIFEELTRELVIQQPGDHVLFVRQVLANAAENRNTARVILLANPKINCMEIATIISQFTKQVIIDRRKIMIYLGNTEVETNNITPELNAKCISALIRKENAYRVGWILVGCIRDEKDAKALLKIGILPTHVIYLIPPFQPKLTDLIYCNIPAYWPQYRRAIFEIRHVFKHLLKEVYLNQQPLQEIVSQCVELMKIRERIIKMKPRILLIGPRGSGRKTQAKLLAEQLGIIFIDFEYLLCQVWMNESDLCKKLQECGKKVCFHSELLTQIVNKRILDPECLEKGWVLTGFPYSESDMKCLDCLDTPPNRVIFLEIDLSVCKERLRHRRINIHTGSTNDIDKNPNTKEKQLALHPKDDIRVIEAELTYYCQNYENLRKYCGKTGYTINADQTERWVYECITAIITRAPVAAPPRRPCCPETPSSSSTGSCLSPVPSAILDCYAVKL